jgi:hypothetical protein
VVLLYSIYYIIDIYVDPIGNYHSRQKIANVSEIRIVLVVLLYSICYTIEIYVDPSEITIRNKRSQMFRRLGLY